MINGGVPLNISAADTATEAAIINVLNELIGDYDMALPLTVAEENSTDYSFSYATMSDADIIWILLCGYLVFFMHAGFSMLEAGSVRHKNAVNIMFKNIATVAVGAIAYYIFGYAFAYGTNNSDKGSAGFIGSGNYAMKDIGDDRHSWFFQFAFAATGATIVSGAVAGRVMIEGYLIVAAWMTAFVYPVVSHWIWSSDGFMSAFKADDLLFDGCGVLDYAGSGVVHMTGGVAAFWAALIVGPRIGRFGPDGQSHKIPPHNMAIVTLGTFILWFGWYGFNCGSTLAFDGANAAKAAVTTTLSPATAALTAVILTKIMYGHYELGLVLNSALGGLVGITAGCTVVEDWAAIIIGFISCLIYTGCSLLMDKVRIDDPVDAISVHGFCGIWGLLAVGIFATPENINNAYSATCAGWEDGLQFGTQLVAVLTIIAWVTLTTVPVFLLLKIANILRVPPLYEERGLDHSEHGGQAAFVGNEFEPTKPKEKEASDTDVEANEPKTVEKKEEETETKPTTEAEDNAAATKA